MNKFVINVDETSSEFRAHVAKRAASARDPKNQITLDELKKRVGKKLKVLRKSEQIRHSI